MAEQVKIRRDTATNLASSTPVEAELGYDITNQRLLVGNGSRAGGVPHVSYKDQQNSTFTSCTLTEASANVYTGTLAEAPPTYASFQEFLVKFPTGNTGSVTVNLNSLGAKTVKKKAGGSLVNLASGDIVAGAIHALFYDGTNLQISDINAVGLTSISQGDLNTSTGTFSNNVTTNITDTIFLGASTITVPGGQYGFFPQTRVSFVYSGMNAGWLIHNNTTSFVSAVKAFAANGNATVTVHGQQRYITASPPYDLGEGEVGGFIFLEVNPSGDIISSYCADTPPWAYNGPTDIRATLKDAQGNKYRKKRKTKNIEKVLRGEEDLEESIELITHSLKNKDMGLIPHPFINYNPANTIVLLDPMCREVRKLIEIQNEGEEIQEFINRIKPDNDILDKRKGPKNVNQVKFSLRSKK